MYIVFFTFFLPIIVTSQKWGSTETLPEDSGLFFEPNKDTYLFQDSWKIITNLEMNIFEEEIQTLTSIIKRSKEVCLDISKFTNPDSCERIQQLVDSSSQEIRNTQNEVKSLVQNHRLSKRSLIDGGGKLIKFLFGNLDNDDATRYDDNIKELYECNINQKQIMEEQTLILKSNFNILKDSTFKNTKNFKLIHNELVDLAESVNETWSELDHFKLEKIAFDLYIATDFNVNLIYRQQTKIINILTYALDGKVHPDLLNPTQIREHMSTYEKQLNPTVRLPYFRAPFSTNLSYKLFSLDISMVNNRLIFRINIPLIKNKKYQTFSVYPIPIKTENETFLTIQNTKPILIIDENREHYTHVEEYNLNQCVGEHIRVCKQWFPLYFVHGQADCVIDSFLETRGTKESICKFSNSKLSQTMWYQLSKSNSWIVVPHVNQIAHVICDNLDIEKLSLQNKMLIHLKPSCTLKTHDVILHSKSTPTITYLNNSIITKFNVSTIIINKQNAKRNFSTYNPQYDYVDNNDINMLSEQIKDLHGQITNTHQTNNTHNIHHFTMIYVIGITLLIIIIFKFKNKLITNNENKINQLEEVNTIKPQVTQSLHTRKSESKDSHELKTEANEVKRFETK